jgi:hypothetical protein
MRSGGPPSRRIRGLGTAAVPQVVEVNAAKPAQAIVTRRAETRRQYRGAPFAQRQ